MVKDLWIPRNKWITDMLEEHKDYKEEVNVCIVNTRLGFTSEQIEEFKKENVQHFKFMVDQVPLSRILDISPKLLTDITMWVVEYDLVERMKELDIITSSLPCVDILQQALHMKSVKIIRYTLETYPCLNPWIVCNLRNRCLRNLIGQKYMWVLPLLLTDGGIELFKWMLVYCQHDSARSKCDFSVMCMAIVESYELEDKLSVHWNECISFCKSLPEWSDSDLSVNY